MSKELLDSIRAANFEFQDFAKLMAPMGNDRRNLAKAFRHLNKIHLRLKHISKCLMVAPMASFDSPEDADDVQRYRANLEALKRAVEALQEKLQAEKARINNVRTNVLAARAWAESIRSYS